MRSHATKNNPFFDGNVYLLAEVTVTLSENQLETILQSDLTIPSDLCLFSNVCFAQSNTARDCIPLFLTEPLCTLSCTVGSYLLRSGTVLEVQLEMVLAEPEGKTMYLASSLRV